MEVAAVFLQPIEMDPPGMLLSAAKADIHLEADIRAPAWLCQGHSAFTA